MFLFFEALAAPVKVLPAHSFWDWFSALSWPLLRDNLTLGETIAKLRIRPCNGGWTLSATPRRTLDGLGRKDTWFATSGDGNVCRILG